MSHILETVDFSNQANLDYPDRPSRMYISGFVTHETLTFMDNVKLRVAGAKDFLGRLSNYMSYLKIIKNYKVLADKTTEQVISTETLPIVSNLQGQKAWHEQQEQYYKNKESTAFIEASHTEVWPHQKAFDQVRQTKLNSFMGLQISALAKFFNRANENGYSLQYVGLAVLTVPALIQLVASPIFLKSDRPDGLYDPIQTSSIVQKPAEPALKKDMWAIGWKVKSGKALQIFSLETPETADLSLSYMVKTHVSGLQEDAMSWSHTNNGEGTKLGAASMFVQRNMPPQGYDSKSIFDEMTMRTKSQGLSIEKISVLSTVPSKFGPVEVIDMTVTDHAQPERVCSAFRTQAHQPNLKLSGWLCADGQDNVERPQLTCFINRLDLMGAPESTSLQTIFRSAETRRGDCPSKGSYLQDASRKAPNWLEIKSPLPALKGAI